MTSQERPAPDGDLSQPKGDHSPPGNYLSVQEYARRTGISEKSVRRYLRDGRLTKHQPGGFNCRVTIPPSALAAPQTGDSSVPPSLSGEPDQPKAPAGKPVPKAATKRPLPKPSWMR